MTSLLTPPVRTRLSLQVVTGTVTATAVPALPAPVAPVRVALPDRLAACLPSRSLRWVVVPDGDVPPDVVVADVDGPDALREHLRRAPRAAVLALLPEHADTATFVAVLAAGADACLRGAGTAEVVAHLDAVVRRRAQHGARPAVPLPAPPVPCPAPATHKDLS